MRFFMGTGQKQMYAVIDTGTDFVAVEGHECPDCKGATHDIRPGLETGDAGISASLSTVQYGVTQI